MLRTTLLAAALVSLALPAFAQPVNSATTVQTGGGLNLSRTDQRGADNAATTVQIGAANGALIRQHGSNSNSAGCGQDGDLNVCDVVQRDRNGN